MCVCVCVCVCVQRDKISLVSAYASYQSLFRLKILRGWRVCLRHHRLSVWLIFQQRVNFIELPHWRHIRHLCELEILHCVTLEGAENQHMLSGACVASGLCTDTCSVAALQDSSRIPPGFLQDSSILWLQR